MLKVMNIEKLHRLISTITEDNHYGIMIISNEEDYDKAIEVAKVFHDKTNKSVIINNNHPAIHVMDSRDIFVGKVDEVYPLRNSKRKYELIDDPINLPSMNTSLIVSVHTDDVNNTIIRVEYNLFEEETNNG